MSKKESQTPSTQKTTPSFNGMADPVRIAHGELDGNMRLVLVNGEVALQSGDNVPRLHVGC